MTETARLRLPEIAASQAQKHVTHNEALTYLDTLVQASVIDKDLTAPPSGNVEGDCYIVAGGGGTATGDWTSWEKRLVRFQDGEWTSFLPGQGDGIGWTVWVQDEETLYTFDGTAWMNALRGKTGGGISVQYTFDTTTTDSDPGSGKLRLNQATQNTATVIRADLLDINGADWTAALDSLDDSSSTVKGHLRLFSVADPADWILFTVSAVAAPAGYRNITVAVVAASAASPFGNGDAVVLAFSRTGDAGTAGSNGSDGVDGTNAGLRWTFDNATSMADPGTGDLRANHGTLSSATALAIAATTAESGNPSALGFLQTFDDSTNTVKGHLLLKKVADPENFRLYAVSALTDNTTWVQLTVTHVAGAGSFANGDVLSLEFMRAGDAGAGSGGSHGLCEGRLTLESGVAVSTADQTAKTTVYLTPYKGNKIGLYDGASAWAILSFAETSLSLSGLTANTNYDIFGYNNSGTLALEALAWTNDTTRATALTLQDGVLVKSGATTRRFLGMIRITGTTGQCEMVFGGSGAGGARISMLVWNAYNRVRYVLQSKDTDGSWTLAAAATRASNNSTNKRASYVKGLVDGFMEAIFHSVARAPNTGAGTCGVGYDTTSSLTGSYSIAVAEHAESFIQGTTFGEDARNAIGFHYFQAMENAAGSGTHTFYGIVSLAGGGRQDQLTFRGEF